VDPLPSARERALRLGADVALDPREVDVVAEVARITDGRMLDVAVDLVGANAVLAQAAATLGRFGRCVMVGLSLDDVQLGPGVFFGIQSQSLLGHLGYKKRHLDELVTLVELGRLDVSGSVSDVLPLEDVAARGGPLTSKEGDPIRLVVQPWAWGPAGEPLDGPSLRPGDGSHYGSDVSLTPDAPPATSSRSPSSARGPRRQGLRRERPAPRRDRSGGLGGP
jgi:hypothetical protein